MAYLPAHPEYLVLRPEGLAEGRTYAAEEEGSLVGFATWIEADGSFELEDLFIDRRGLEGRLAGPVNAGASCSGLCCGGDLYK